MTIGRSMEPISDNLLNYSLGEGVEAFSTMRDARLPYHVICGHQVHDVRVAVIDRPDMTRGDLEGYDAFITNLKGCAIGVRTADCIPVLLYDPLHEAVAAVHSGWKGTVRKISLHTIHAMHDTFGTNASDLSAMIGPGISRRSFQVGEEVVGMFRESGFPMDEIWQYDGEPVPGTMQGGHHIDLIQANRWLLEGVGVRPENIHSCDICTYEDRRFYSARREGTKCGRIINSIRIRCHISQIS